MKINKQTLLLVIGIAVLMFSICSCSEQEKPVHFDYSHLPVVNTGNEQPGDNWKLDAIKSEGKFGVYGMIHQRAILVKHGCFISHNRTAVRLTRDLYKLIIRQQNE